MAKIKKIIRGNIYTFIIDSDEKLFMYKDDLSYEDIKKQNFK